METAKRLKQKKRKWKREEAETHAPEQHQTLPHHWGAPLFSRSLHSTHQECERGCWRRYWCWQVAGRPSAQRDTVRASLTHLNGETSQHWIRISSIPENAAVISEHSAAARTGTRVFSAVPVLSSCTVHLLHQTLAGLHYSLGEAVRALPVR